MRLAKYLAQSGVASRRASERIVQAGEVRVNGKVVKDPARDVDDSDIILVGGETLQRKADQDFVYIMLNKPAGVVSTMSTAGAGEPSIADLVKTGQRIFPVGRLDRDSHGLIIMTNDGDLTNLLTHPSRGVQKEYLVKTQRPFAIADFERLSRGISVDGRVVEMFEITPARGGRVSIVIHEGRKRIIRRAFKAIGHNVTELKRIRIGTLQLSKLRSGTWRKMTAHEVESLKKLVESF